MKAVTSREAAGRPEDQRNREHHGECPGGSHSAKASRNGRSLHHNVSRVTTEAYSPAEETFNRRRQAFGLIAGPALAIAILLLPSALAPAAQRVGAVLALMIVSG